MHFDRKRGADAVSCCKFCQNSTWYVKDSPVRRLVPRWECLFYAIAR